MRTVHSNSNIMKRKKNGRPYKLTVEDHLDLIRRKAAGQKAEDLAPLFKIGLHTVYAYLKLDPRSRWDS